MKSLSTERRGEDLLIHDFPFNRQQGCIGGAGCSHDGGGGGAVLLTGDLQQKLQNPPFLLEHRLRQESSVEGAEPFRLFRRRVVTNHCRPISPNRIDRPPPQVSIHTLSSDHITQMLDVHYRICRPMSSFPSHPFVSPPPPTPPRVDGEKNSHPSIRPCTRSRTSSWRASVSDSSS